MVVLQPWPVGVHAAGGHLLEGVVDRGRELAPGRADRLGLGVLELGAEHRDVRVALDVGLVPAGLDGRQVGRGLVPEWPGSSGRTGTSRTPRRRPCSWNVLEDDDVAAAEERGASAASSASGRWPTWPRSRRRRPSLIRPRCHGPEKNIG